EKQRDLAQERDQDRRVHLSGKQVQRIQEMVNELEKKQRDLAGGDQERLKKPEEAIQIWRQNEKTALALLNPEQAKRLKQIYLHYKGTASLWDREFRDELNVTDEKVERMKACHKDLGAWDREAEEQFRKNKDFPDL